MNKNRVKILDVDIRSGWENWGVNILEEEILGCHNMLQFSISISNLIRGKREIKDTKLQTIRGRNIKVETLDNYVEHLTANFKEMVQKEQILSRQQFIKCITRECNSIWSKRKSCMGKRK